MIDGKDWWRLNPATNLTTELDGVCLDLTDVNRCLLACTPGDDILTRLLLPLAVRYNPATLRIVVYNYGARPNSGSSLKEAVPHICVVEPVLGISAGESVRSSLVKTHAKRNRLFMEKDVRTIEEYNNLPGVAPMQRIITIVQGYAPGLLRDLHSRRTQLARTGQHLIIISQHVPISDTPMFDLCCTSDQKTVRTRQSKQNAQSEKAQPFTPEDIHVITQELLYLAAERLTG